MQLFWYEMLYHCVNITDIFKKVVPIPFKGLEYGEGSTFL